MLEVDELAELPSGYSAKLLSAPREKGGHYQRNIGGESMEKLLTALGVVIRIEPAPADCFFLEGKSNCPQVLLLRERARAGGLKRFAKLTKAQKTELGRKAGLASAAKRRANSLKTKQKAKARPDSFAQIAAAE